jgi:hypothetical protein
MKLLYTLFLAAAIVLSFVNADNVPVLLGPSGNQKQQPVSLGSTLDSQTFLALVKQLINSNNNPLISILAIDNLNSEDLLFNDYKKNNAVLFYPSVMDPYQTLVDYLNTAQYEVNKYSVGNVSAGLGQFDALCKTGDSIVIFTGIKANSLALPNSGRRRRQASQSDMTESSYNNNGTFYVFGNGACAAIFSDIYYLNQTKGINSTENVLTIANTTNTFACQSNTSAVLTINFIDPVIPGQETITSMTFNFNSDLTEWQLVNATAISSTDTYTLIFSGNDIGFQTPLQWSFVCTRAQFMMISNTRSNLKDTLFIENLQVQPFYMSMPNASAYTFGKANYCQSFFTSAIWMAISSGVILFIILTCGISMLSQINTMDRFDDPKGKLLVIAAEK